VHNGIEYGMMQLIAESYDMLKSIGGFSNEELAEAFAHWSEGDDLQGFLMEITASIFTKKEKKGHLIDVIADRAGQKGTGKWTTEAAMTLGVAIPTINAAVDARILSGAMTERLLAQEFPESVDLHDSVPPKQKLRSIVRAALELGIICAYNQGFRLIEAASTEYGWNINMGEVARIWRGGCIIRSGVLKKFQRAYGDSAKDAKAGSESILNRFEGERQLDLRRAIEYASSRGVPVPAMSASLSYYDALRRERLPQNLVQAQRDFFGAHGFERVDKKGSFHGEW